MSQLPVGTLLRAVHDDHADEPFNFEILVDDLVMVVAQDGDKHHGDTTMLSLMSGVFYRVEYTSDCPYEAMENTYELFTP